MMMVIHVYPVDPNLSVVSNVSKIQNKNTNSVLERSSLITRNTTTQRMSRFPWKAKEEPKIIRSCSLSLSSLPQPCITWRYFSLSLIFPISFLILLPLSHPLSLSLSLSLFSFSLSFHSLFPFFPMFPIHIPTLLGLSHVRQVVVFEGWSVQNEMKCVSFSLPLLEWNKHSFGLNLGVWVSVGPDDESPKSRFPVIMYYYNSLSLSLSIFSLSLYPLPLSSFSFFLFFLSPSLYLIVPLLKHSVWSIPSTFFLLFLCLSSSSFFSLSSSPLYLNTISMFPFHAYIFPSLLFFHPISSCVVFLPSFGFCSLPLLCPLLPFSLLSGQSWERISGLLLIRAWKENEGRNETQEKTKGKREEKEWKKRKEQGKKVGSGKEKKERQASKREPGFCCFSNL